jgi:hypothetical protein
VPIVDLNVSDHARRRLAQLRVMCTMTFPDDPKLRAGSEIAYWTQFAALFSDGVAKQDQPAPSPIICPIRANLDSEPVSELADSGTRTRRRFLASLLAPYGGRHDAILQLADTPSVDELNREWAARWWDIFYTGKALSLIGSIHRYHAKMGASLNKAIFILRETEARRPMRGFRQLCESNLNKAWTRFRPVAHLCAAYFQTECDHYKEEMARDFGEYWEKPPALFDDVVFQKFLLLAKAAEDFATTYCPRGRQQPLISREEIFALPEGVIDPACVLPEFEPLTEAEFAALDRYRAPQQLV